MKTKTKRILSIALCLALALTLLPAAPAHAAGDVAINATNFPDANFRAYISENKDTNGNKKLSKSEIAAVTEINCEERSIASPKGIESFTALTRLYCGKNQLTSLNVNKNIKLKYLYCESNRLTALDVSKCTALRRLVCYGNQLEALDLSACPVLVEQMENTEGSIVWYDKVVYGSYTLKDDGKFCYCGPLLWVSVDTKLTPAPAHPPLIPKPTITTQPKSASVYDGGTAAW